MKQSWRSWFWNLVLFCSAMVMAAIMTGVAVQEANTPPAAVGFGIGAAAFWAGVVRALFIGVSAGVDGITMRGFLRTIKIPWAEVEAITGDRQEAGPAGFAGATTAVVLRKRPGQSVQRVELSALGGYGVIRRRPTLADRAIAGLKDCLEQWRREN